LRKALERLQPKHGADVHLHPTDLDVLRGRHAVGFSSLASDETLRFIPNPALRRGECKIQAGELLVWTDFDTQLDELQELLLEEAIAADPELLAPPPRAPGETDAS
jgi:flagellar biosynthesis/type III secretory pathway protein FliH